MKSMFNILLFNLQANFGEPSFLRLLEPHNPPGLQETAERQAFGLVSSRHLLASANFAVGVVELPKGDFFHFGRPEQEKQGTDQ